MKHGNVLRIILAVIFAITGIYQISNAFSNDGHKEIVKETVGINEFAVDKDNVGFCVTNVDNSKSLGSGYFEVTTDYNYAVVTIEIFNNGVEPYDVNTLRFVLMNGDTEYEYAAEAIFSLEDSMYLDTINPGISKEYKIPYEIPTSTDDGEYMLKIKPYAYTDKNCVYIALKETK